MALIWRIENRQGQGPYHGTHPKGKGRGWPWMPKSRITVHQYPMRPGPWNDAGINRWPKGDELHGFSSEKQLRAWFNVAELRNLRKLGFEEVILRGEITAKGERQILFRRG